MNGAYITHYIRDVLMFAMLSVGVSGSYVRFFMTHTRLLCCVTCWEVFDMFEASDMV